MKDHILCAIDFSESSIQALGWANKIASGTDARLSVLYSYRLIQTGKVADILLFKRKTEEESRKKYLEMERTLPEGNTSRNFYTEIGFFSDNIANFIRKNSSTLVVISESLANEIFDHKGETLLHFLKSLNIPLLIVPNGEASTSVVGKQAETGKVPI